MIRHHLDRILICLILVEILLVSTVYAVGVSPIELKINIEKGKEKELMRNIQVLNSYENPIHVTATVTGSVSQFIALEKTEFDLPAGPGMHSDLASPYQYVKVNFKIPRELSQSKYNGEILFTEKATKGGMLATATQVGVYVELTIGSMAKAVFPMYMNALLVILVLVLFFSIFYKRK
jgi:hypothetical protein